MKEALAWERRWRKALRAEGSTSTEHGGVRSDGTSWERHVAHVYRRKKYKSRKEWTVRLEGQVGLDHVGSESLDSTLLSRGTLEGFSEGVTESDILFFLNLFYFLFIYF